MTEPTDAELMALTKSGEKEAFGQLVDRHKDALVNTLTRLTCQRDRAEDLAQEAFLKLYRLAPRYEEQGRLLPLLYQIATNQLRSEERRRRRWRALLPLIQAPLHPEPEPSDQMLLATETQRQVSAAIAALPLRYRVPLVLHEIEGWPYEEIAALCGTPEGTVKSRINRGRQRLREILAPYWNGVASCTTTAS